MNIRRLSGLVLLAMLPVAGVSLVGCHAPGGAAVAPQSQSEQKAEMEDLRDQLQPIPLPTKGQYMAIHSFDSWENPYLVVQVNMVELHVMRGDSNTTGMGLGGMFRPKAARMVELNLSDDKVGEAVASIPADAWPYGRVVAIGAPQHTPDSAKAGVQRNMDRTITLLNELGVQVYDPTAGKLE